MPQNKEDNNNSESSTDFPDKWMVKTSIFFSLISLQHFYVK